MSIKRRKGSSGPENKYLMEKAVGPNHVKMGKILIQRQTNVNTVQWNGCLVILNQIYFQQKHLIIILPDFVHFS